MSSFETKIKSALVKTVPLAPDTTRDWEDVIRRAEAPENAVAAVRARRSTRSYLARRLVPVFVLAAAALVIGLIAPWQHGRPFTGSAVAERALVAIGNGPVLHVVLRHEDFSGSNIDLASGQETRTYTSKEEIWYDSERHFERLKLVTESNPTDVIREILQTPTETWSSFDANPGDVPSLDPALGGFLDGYRSALENGSAHVTGTGTVDGRDVTWIEFTFDDRENDLPYVERVAVDETSSLPIRLEIEVLIDSQPVRKLHSNFEILSIETLPAGSGDFSKPEKKPIPVYRAEHDQVTSITPSAAAQALPGALWVGKSISKLQLSSVSRARLTMQALLPRHESTEPIGTGIELHYGNGSPGEGVLWSSPSSNANEEPSGSYIVLQEAAKNFASQKPPPAGSIHVESLASSFGWLVKNGAYVFITASSRALLLEAARALEPIQP